MTCNLGLSKDFLDITQKAQAIKKSIHWTSFKLRTTVLWKTLLRKWKDKPQTGRKYSQNTYVIKDLRCSQVSNVEERVRGTPRETLFPWQSQGYWEPLRGAPHSAEHSSQKSPGKMAESSQSMAGKLEWCREGSREFLNPQKGFWEGTPKS